MMKRFTKLLLRLLVAIFIFLNIVVAFHAYKFTHFYNWGEVAIIPDKEKSRWNITKDILFGMDFIKQKNSFPDTAFSNIYLITKSGLKLEAWYMQVFHAKGSVAMFHGHGSKKSGLLNEAAVFRKLGYNTLLLDFRAHGNSDGNTCTLGERESEDVKLAYDFLAKSGEKNIILYGISLGAATITKTINDYKEVHPAKIILDMPFGSIQNAVRSRIKMMHLPPEPLATVLTFWGGLENGFWAYNIKPSEYAKKINCPVLLQRGKYDPRVSAEETQAIYNNIHTSKKFVLYENSAHESLCKKEVVKWTNEVTTFLQ